MAPEWYSVYRNYDDAKLDAEIAWLEGQSRNVFNSQTEGNRSYARSTVEIRDRLDAAYQVKNERNPSNGVGNKPLIADFSGVRIGGNW
jgi:hypothetical protein